MICMSKSKELWTTTKEDKACFGKPKNLKMTHRTYNYIKGCFSPDHSESGSWIKDSIKVNLIISFMENCICNTINANLFFSVQIKGFFFIDIQTWSTQCQFSSSLFCWFSGPVGLSCLFIFSFLHLLLDILSLILTAQYLTDASSMFVVIFSLFWVLLFYCSVDPAHLMFHD